MCKLYSNTVSIVKIDLLMHNYYFNHENTIKFLFTYYKNNSLYNKCINKAP